MYSHSSTPKLDTLQERPMVDVEYSGMMKRINFSCAQGTHKCKGPINEPMAVRGYDELGSPKSGTFMACISPDTPMQNEFFFPKSEGLLIQLFAFPLYPNGDGFF